MMTISLVSISPFIAKVEIEFNSISITLSVRNNIKKALIYRGMMII